MFNDGESHVSLIHMDKVITSLNNTLDIYRKFIGYFRPWEESHTECYYNYAGQTCDKWRHLLSNSLFQRTVIVNPFE